ncbi:MAG: SDR family NAD(P)-dependent oxidoreductase, partial [Pseudonocardiales bacterium]
MQIAGSVALVTGGASGLGLATAARLIQADAQVVLLDLPSSPGAAAADALGPSATFRAGDVTSEADVTAALDLAAANGTIRIVVNCAGVGTAGRVIGRNGVLPLDQFARVVQINLIGTFN